MAKSTPQPANPIDALLEERARFESWLARLDSTGSTAPPAVRDKIRGDYQQRLTQVIEELKTHAAAVAEQLATLRVREGDLAEREAAAQETLAEAELRHAVGEYEESEWERVRGGSERLLLDVREELARVSDEITRLGEVQALIAAKPKLPEPVPAPTPAPAPAAATAPEPDDWEPLIPLADSAAEKTPAPAPSAPRFTPRTGARPSEPTPPRTIPFPGRSEAIPGRPRIPQVDGRRAAGDQTKQRGGRPRERCGGQERRGASESRAGQRTAESGRNAEDAEVR